MAYHRLRAVDEARARVSRMVYGATGFLQQQWDPRLHALHAGDASIRPTFSRRCSLSGRVLRSDSVDAGWRVVLAGSAGQPLLHWDSRGGRQRRVYDAMLRPRAVFEQAATQLRERCVERLNYGPADAEHAAKNCCGRLIRHDDPAGRLYCDDYGLTGALTGQSRRLLQSDDPVHWPERPGEDGSALQTERYASRWRYNALGALLDLADARGNHHLSRYAVDGQLGRVELLLRSGKRKVLLEQRACNALGQVISERSGNGMHTEADYDPADGRLQRLATWRRGQRDTPLQDLSYAYDRVGNVRSLRDAAQPTAWASNARIDAVSLFEYDSLSQLVMASGRENARNVPGPGLPEGVMFGAGQDDLWRNYTRRYHYDAAGNLLHMQHRPSSGQGYSQRMKVAAHSNHSVLQGPGGDFDRCGNQQALAPGQALAWNLRNQLARVTRVVREDGTDDAETYHYDGAGQRVIKRRTSKARGLNHVHEVIYLPGLQLHRDHATGQWLNVLSVAAGGTTVRALQWEQGLPAGVDDEQLRFCLSDLTGSCTLELDEQAALLSQEGFYPFGATAWWAARSAIEARFKTLRYSGRERDASGLYYFGYRYYAPWLQRWISPDPAGDGLNLYLMVDNNPMTVGDPNGLGGIQLAGARVKFGLVMIAGLSVAGFFLGSQIQAAELGALGGGLVGAFDLVHSLYLEREAARAAPLAAPSQEDKLDAWLSNQALDLAESRGLSHIETNRLLNFFYERSGDRGRSVAAHTTPAGKIYAFIGPARSTEMANELIKTGRPLGKEMRQLGYHTILLRDPTHSAQVSSPGRAGLSRFEVQATTQLARRRVSGDTASAEGGKEAVPVAHEPATSFSIDASQIAHLMQGREGRSIALTLGHLAEGRTAAVHWHRHHDEGGLWSADLHGYPGGGTGRGALRLMFEHMGGRRYRVVGVRDPHR